MSISSNGYVWMEKYRPKNMSDIVLDDVNKKILKNIIETQHFPNLLFYGPPGTGKTTTIINLINAYQEKLNIKNKDLIIHLNASDERGIDVIRNQIYFFANSKPLFNNGMKFVILDEVDYMTKNAQQALKYLLQNYSNNIRFCLICNYISKIYEALQNEFVKLRFNQLPKNEIINFIKNISINENLNISNKTLSCIQKLYGSDIRSMINFMQTNQNLGSKQMKIIDNDIWDNLVVKILKKENKEIIFKLINKISNEYNIDKKNIIKDFLNYFIRNYPKHINTKILNFFENLTHTQNQNNNINIYYLITQMQSLL